MTNDTEQVLKSIDDAIEGYVTNDYNVSADAMRWAPEPADEEETAPELQPRTSAQWIESLLALVRHEVQCSVAELEAWYAEARRLADESFEISPTRISLPRRFPPCINCGGPVEAFSETDELHPRGRRISFSPCGCELRVAASQMLAVPGTSGEGFDRRAARLGTLSFQRPVFATDAARQVMNAFQQVVFPQFTQVQRAFTEIGKALRRTVDANHPTFAPLQYGDDYRRHYRSCRLCNPAGNPKPLPVNGAEYRRRARSRRRRNRR